MSSTTVHLGFASTVSSQKKPQVIFSTNNIKLSSRHFNPSTRMSLDQPSFNFNIVVKTITKLLWGQSLPPQLLISTVRSTWSTVWQLMMSQLAPSDPTGRYTRPSSQFRITPSNPYVYNSDLDNLHLYVGLPCPWAHRTLIVRALKGLEDAIPVSIAAPGMDGSWEFREGNVISKEGGKLVCGLDKVNNCRTLKQVYNLRRGGYSGRCSVPMLWNVDKKEVVCNESYDMIEFFNSGLNEVAGNPGLDLSPPSLRKEMDEWNEMIYPNINNGVYRCGFAQSQEAYDIAVNDLFETMEKVEEHLGKSRYLCGEELTVADVCLFTTLIRFDIVYNVIFKCTKKKVIEYPNLDGYVRDIYQIPKVSETCNLMGIMEGYYKILFPLNPGGITPILPSNSHHQSLLKPHNRDRIG